MNKREELGVAAAIAITGLLAVGVSRYVNRPEPAITVLEDGKETEPQPAALENGSLEVNIVSDPAVPTVLVDKDGNPVNGSVCVGTSGDANMWWDGRCMTYDEVKATWPIASPLPPAPQTIITMPPVGCVTTFEAGLVSIRGEYVERCRDVPGKVTSLRRWPKEWWEYR